MIIQRLWWVIVLGFVLSLPTAMVYVTPAEGGSSDKCVSNCNRNHSRCMNKCNHMKTGADKATCKRRCNSVRDQCRDACGQ